MAFAFSFFSEHSSGDYPLELVAETTGSIAQQEQPAASALSWVLNERVPDPKEHVPTAHEHVPLTQEPVPVATGLAAMAVQQSASTLLSPPSRRLSGYMTPGSAIAASLALAAQPAPASLPELPRQTEPPVPSAPATNHYQSIQNLQNRDLAQLRMDLEAEIEQVRQDLFGAAMGVSALKDRIDGLESTVEKKPAPVPAFSKAEVEHLVRDWLETHLPPKVEQAVQEGLDQAVQQTISTLSSSEFFRMPVHTPGLNPATLLSQAPHILSSSLT